MPTIISHPAVPLTVGIMLSQRIVSKRLLIAGMVGAILPDLDVIGYQFGVPRGTDFAHRGFSHSLLFAASFGLFGAFVATRLQAKALTAFLFLFVSMASHGVLDAFTNGGSGIALLWPFSSERFVAPVRPIEVSPIGITRFLSERGVSVLWSELRWIWLPCLSLVTLAWLWRRYGKSER